MVSGRTLFTKSIVAARLRFPSLSVGLMIAGRGEKIVPPFLAKEFSVGMPAAQVKVLEDYDLK